MNKSILVIACGLATVTGFAQTKKPAATTAKPGPKTATATVNPFKNNIDSVSYAVGLSVARSFESQGLTNVNMALFTRAMNDAKLKKTPILNDAAIAQCIGQFQQKANAEKDVAAKQAGLANRKIGETFLSTNGKRPGVVTLPSGLQYEVLKASTDNTKPKLTDKVKVHYHGTLIDGTVFDSSVERGEPIVYPVNGFVIGWQEVLQLMTVGSKWKVYLPADLAYGDRQSGEKIGPGSTLVFELELLGIEN